MSAQTLLLLVRRHLHIVLLLFGCVHLSLGADLPAPPANHLYDPDFLLSKQAASDLGEQLPAFAQRSDVSIYLAIYTATPRPIEETAEEVNQAWNQSGYGVVIVFAPRRGESRVLPSPQLSLLENAEQLSALFRDAAQKELVRGDYSAAASSGAAALMKRLQDVDARSEAPAKPSWTPTRGEKLLGAAGVVLAGLIFLAVALRVWRAANLFDHSYRFPVPTEPASLRFGGRRCGGLLATSKFPVPREP
jgi:uncharacterized membrane protein YgcG